ncbi:MAG: heme o synthase [Myxococcota bacterium]
MKTSNQDKTYGVLRYVKDAVTLTKPRITLLSVGTAAAGMSVSDTSFFRSPHAWLSLLGVGLLVASSSVLNMHAERVFDGLMPRTRNRPLPSGRFRPEIALALGWGLAVFAVVVLAIAANGMTLGLGASALLLYVFAYTPLKRKSSSALFVGALAGAMPPLLGTTAVTGSLDSMGLALFMILFVWQIPHFVAISLLHGAQYRRAGFVVFSEVFGTVVSKWAVTLSALLLWLASLVPWWLGGAGFFYALCACVTGSWFTVVCATGFKFEDTGLARWARRVFRASLLVPLLLFGGLGVGAVC